MYPQKGAADEDKGGEEDHGEGDDETPANAGSYWNVDPNKKRFVIFECEILKYRPKDFVVLQRAKIFGAFSS